MGKEIKRHPKDSMPRLVDTSPTNRSMANANRKSSGATGEPSNIEAKWNPGTRTQRWDELWRRILGDLFQAGEKSAAPDPKKVNDG